MVAQQTAKTVFPGFKIPPLKNPYQNNPVAQSDELNGYLLYGVCTMSMQSVLPKAGYGVEEEHTQQVEEQMTQKHLTTIHTHCSTSIQKITVSMK